MYLLVAAALLAAGAGLRADPYEDYIRHSEDFRPVRQEKAWALHAFPSWTYMPWTHQWTIGYTEDSGRWSVAHGYTGAFMDRGENSPPGRLAWIDRFHLRFYMDHAAGKGLLHLWDGGELKAHAAELHGTGVRPVPLNAATRDKLQALLREHIAHVKASPNRAAYALDDEASWGHFVHPAMWQVTDDPAAYPKWLSEIYGPSSPKRDRWVSYEDLRGRLPSWTVREFDASPLMDQWTFNDSVWTRYLGGLVEYSNTLDPATPCGLVGGQMPSPFGGYDYARLMRKVQFLEAYNLGSSQAIIRSFNPHNALPILTTAFHRSSADDIWQTWYYLAHGNRGQIGWVENWFDGTTPMPWHEEVAPAYLEAAQKIGPLLAGAEWKHDGIAILYSHPSIQLGWILDAQAHGKTWGNRNADERLSSAAHVRHAWENMLRDAGLQYNYLSYLDLIATGVPADIKALILPACLSLSDAEARAIEAFCARGGTVIADYLPGVWDQHGKGRAGGGALDALFGVRHDPALSARDLFGGKLWVEVDQDARYSWTTFDEFLTKDNAAPVDAGGFHRAVRDLPVRHAQTHGRGNAVLMNLSPQWYNAARSGPGAEAARAAFLQPLTAAGLKPRVRLKDPSAAPTAEITYWSQGDRTVLFLCQNPEITGNSEGGGNSLGLGSGTIRATLQFTREVKDLRNERTGETLPSGREITLPWKQNEALVLSFR